MPRILFRHLPHVLLFPRNYPDFSYLRRLQYFVNPVDKKFMMHRMLNMQNVLNNKPDRIAFGFLCCNFIKYSVLRMRILTQTPNVRPLRREFLGGCKYLHSAYVQFIFAKFARVCPPCDPELSRSGDSKTGSCPM